MRTHHQLGADTLFQGLDATAKCRMRDETVLRRPRKTARARQFDEVFQPDQMHVAVLVLSRFSAITPYRPARSTCKQYQRCAYSTRNVRFRSTSGCASIAWR